MHTEVIRFVNNLGSLNGYASYKILKRGHTPRDLVGGTLLLKMTVVWCCTGVSFVSGPVEFPFGW